MDGTMVGTFTPVLSRFLNFLEDSRGAASSHADYLQWFRSYLDYYAKNKIA